jgi:hypothetical protein
MMVIEGVRGGWRGESSNPLSGLDPRDLAAFIP